MCVHPQGQPLRRLLVVARHTLPQVQRLLLLLRQDVPLLLLLLQEAPHH
jgi:hypothetical protein